MGGFTYTRHRKLVYCGKWRIRTPGSDKKAGFASATQRNRCDSVIERRKYEKIIIYFASYDIDGMWFRL